ncbi:MAG TPA: LysR substrate-binding domain-containing protein [Kofleriaceae bacterium]|nr:LysR substrate-binding domain-containing protein [Kofleriaceae bacterium]
MGTPSLDLLSLFVAVAQAGSFSAAAKRLQLPKSTVSRGVAALERDMGVRLLHRTTRQVSLSTAGAALLEKVAPQLAALESALALVPEREGQPSGRLRVTASVDFASAVLAGLVAGFTARYPAVEIDLRITNQVLDLVAEGIDLAIRATSRRMSDSSLTVRSTGPIHLQLYAAPAYMARRGTPRQPSELDQHEWVVFRGGLDSKLEGPGVVVGIQPRGRTTCDDMLFVREAVRHGVGIGILPGFLAEADVAAGTLVRVLPRWSIRGGQLLLMWPGGRHPPAKVAAFRDFVLDAIQRA